MYHNTFDVGGNIVTLGEDLWLVILQILKIDMQKVIFTKKVLRLLFIDTLVNTYK